MALLAAGCATDQPQAGGVKAWPAPPPAGYAMVFLYVERHDTLRTHPTAHVDDRKLVSLPNDSYTWWYLRPGSHILRVLWDDRFAKLNAHLPHEIKADERIFLRLDTRSHRSSPADSVSAQIMPVSEDLARKATETSVYRAPAKTVIDWPR